MAGSYINERYRLKEEIGKGGMGTVYRAQDEILQREVALKLFTNTRLGKNGRARLLHEAQTVAKFNHSNIVVVHDAGEHDDTPFIVMELVEGYTLDGQKFESLDKIVETTKQICQALNHAHQQGIVHRDLKPENVIIEPNGNLKLMDFGLARSVASRMTSEGKIIGTVHYISPEQVTGGEVDGRADLYALGVMLYELVTGSLPFDADDPISIIGQHIHAPVVPPKAKREDLPNYLNRLIVSLLSKDPSDRPSSVREVIDLLDPPTKVIQDADESEELSLLDRIVRGRIIGRKKEVKDARNLWKKATAGNGQLLLISGEPGIGKTRLTREIATHAEVSGGQTFSGESFAEGGAPYSAISQIVRIALDKNKNLVEDIPESILADLLQITPDLQHLYPNLPSRPFMDPHSELQRLLESSVSFFAALAEQNPLLLLFEDLHWADSGTIHMVRHLARRTHNLPIMILVTYREIEIEEAQPFQDFLLDMDRARLATRIKLSRLDKEQTGKLLAAIFQEDITSEFLTQIHRETEGNPFFVEEICKSLVESGQVYYENGEWHRPENINDLVIPQSIKTTIEQRLNQLKGDSKRVLTLASVVGREFDFEVLLKLVNINENSLLDVIDEALVAQLIREKRAGGRYKYSFEHALINHTLYEDLNLRRKARLHLQVGLAMESVYSSQVDVHVEDLAHHFYLGASGEYMEKAINYNVKAAEQALKVFAFEDAVKFYEQAINLLEDLDRIPETVPIWIMIGDVHLASINRPETIKTYVKAIELWEGLPENDKNLDVGIKAYSKTGESRRWGVIVPGARQYVEKGISLIDDHPTMVRARLLKGLAWVTSFLVSEDEKDLQLAEKAGGEALSIFKTYDAYDEISIMMDCLASVHWRKHDFPKALEVTEQRLEIIEEVSVAERMDTYHMMGDYSYLFNDFAKAEQYELKALEMALENSHFAWQFQIRWDLARLYIEWDRWEDALQTINEYIALDEDTAGIYWNSNVSVPGLALAASMIYQLRTEQQKARALRVKASPSHISEEEIAQSFRMHRDRVLNVELLISLDKIQEAQELRREISRDRLHWTNPLRINYIDLVLSDEPALKEMTELENQAKEQTPWDALLIGKILRSGGIGYLKSGIFDKAGAKLNQSSETFAKLGTHWQQAKTVAILGDLYAQQGDKDGAIEKYDLAISLFEVVNAQFNIDKVRGKLKSQV